MCQICEKYARLQVIRLNFLTHQALLDNGEIIPICVYKDSNGEDCPMPLAVVCVCGSDQTGYYVLELPFISPVTYH